MAKSIWETLAKANEADAAARGAVGPAALRAASDKSPPAGEDQIQYPAVDPLDFLALGIPKVAAFGARTAARAAPVAEELIAKHLSMDPMSLKPLVNTLRSGGTITEEQGSSLGMRDLVSEIARNEESFMAKKKIGQEALATPGFYEYLTKESPYRFKYADPSVPYQVDDIHKAWTNFLQSPKFNGLK